MINYKDLQEKGICWTGYKRKKGTKPYEDGSCVKEESEKHHAIAFGRMNPITSGHEAVVNKLHSVAKEHGASHNLIVSHSQDAKKNPLSAAQKVTHAKNAFPGTKVTAASKETPTILHHAAAAHAAGVTHLHVIAGSDRHEEMHNLLNKYNGQNAAHGHYNFKKITVHSSGERDPDAEGTTGISASKMREHAAAGNKKEFHKGAPSKMKPEHKDAMYNDVRKGMGINEDIYTSEYKIKTWVDPVTGETKTRKIRPHRIDFKNSRMGATPSQPAVKEQAPVAPVPNKKYIKGTPEHKAYKATKKPINGMPTNQCKEETMDQQADRKMQLKRFKDQMTKANGPQVDTEIPLDKKEKDVMLGKIKVKKTPTGLSKEDKQELHDVNEVLRPEMGASTYINDFIKSTNPRFNNKSKEERRKMAIGAYMAAKARGVQEARGLAGKYYSIAQDRKETADQNKGNHETYHTHMGDYHDHMSRYHEELGQHSHAQAHADKAEIHHEKSMQRRKAVKEGTMQANGTDKIDTQTSAPTASTVKDTTQGKKIKGFKFFNGASEQMKESALQKFRAEADARAKKHDEIEAKRKKAAEEGKENMSAAITALSKQVAEGWHEKPASAYRRPADHHYQVTYYDKSGKASDSSKRFAEKEKAEAHADKGNAIDKVGGSYRVHRVGSPIDEASVPQKGVNVDNVNAAGQEPHEEKWEPVKKKVTKIKKEETMKSYKEFLQALDEKLIGKQKKLDKNHNNKLDSEDFAMLRKEEVESIEELSKKTLGKYINKAASSSSESGRKFGVSQEQDGGEDELGSGDDYHLSTMNKRQQGIKAAVKKLTKEEYIDEVKMADLPSRKIQGKSYGADYTDPEGADDADDKKPAKAAGRKLGQSIGTYKRRQPKAAC